MITLIEAMKIAQEYFLKCECQEVTKFFDSDRGWIAFGGYKGKQIIGVESILINKENGEIESFVLPTKENFEILKSATEISMD